jgi:hypothetical protein
VTVAVGRPDLGEDGLRAGESSMRVLPSRTTGKAEVRDLGVGTGLSRTALARDDEARSASDAADGAGGAVQDRVGAWRSAHEPVGVSAREPHPREIEALAVLEPRKPGRMASSVSERSRGA